MDSQTVSFKWNATDYARNASAQYTWAAELMDKLALQGNEDVLDLGCGDGRISADLAGRVPGGRVLGIDASAGMIATAQEHYPVEEYRNLGFAQMDARAIELARPVDVVFSNAALHWVDDHRAVLSGLQHAVRPGGRILLQMGGYGNATAFLASVNAVMEQARWRDCFRGFHSPYHFYHRDDYENWLPEHGFSALRTELIPKQMRHDSVEGLKGWFRTTWFPYTERVPHEARDTFIDAVIGHYLEAHPVNENGATSVAMVRLEVEALRDGW